MKNNEDIIPVICGPTACGKTSLAVSLFGGTDCTAVSADSMQVYRYMDIGTAKPSPDEITQLPHELISIVDPDQTYSAGAFFNDAVAAIEKAKKAGRRACVIGGTGLYIKALIQGFFSGPPADTALRENLLQKEKLEPGALYQELCEKDPESAAVLHPNDTVRIVRALEVSMLTGKSIAGLRVEKNRQVERVFKTAALIRDRDVLKDRIYKRVIAMFDKGFPEEAENLLNMGYPEGLSAFRGLGYQTCFAYVKGRIPRETAIEQIASETRAFAVRQIKLFKQLPDLVWFHASDEKGLKKWFECCRG